MEDIPEVLSENRVKIVASMPCYTEEGMDSQRGKGTYGKAIDAFKKLNSLGYGREETELKIDIMFNPRAKVQKPKVQKSGSANLSKITVQ